MSEQQQTSTDSRTDSPQIDLDAEEIDLPIKRTEGDTLKDRMTANAYENILPARYLRKNTEGEVIEDQEEVFERVGRNIALAELVYIDSDVSVQPKHLKQGHHKRAELCEEVFGEGVTLEDTTEITLTEDNVYAFDFDAIVADLPEEIASGVEDIANEYVDLMENLSFIPNTPTIINAGDDFQQLSACFVLSPEDDISDIHEKAKESAEIFQSGGGTGYAFHKLRPYGDTVTSTGGISSGPLSFMNTFDQVCSTIAQGGVRRGAQMGIMKIDHPDVPYFIHAKNKDVSLAKQLKLNDPDDFTHNSFSEALEEARDLIDEDGRVPEHLRNAVEGHLSNFNISVGVTDEFMEAVFNDDTYELINPRTDEPHIATQETKEMYGWFDLDEYVEVGEPLELPAREVWNRVIDGAHENGEPGVIFLERANKMHSFDVDEYPDKRINATNPCGEQPLIEYEACNLGHINLSTLVSQDVEHWKTFDGAVPQNGLDEGAYTEDELEEAVSNFLDQALDWDELDHRIEYGTRFLDNVVTMSDFPVEEIGETVKNHRKIGLGIMGLAQMYVQIGTRYGSDVSNEIARQVMQYINHESKQVSHDLADQRGNFNEWNKSKFADPTEYPDWFEKLTGEDPNDWEDGFPLRNHNTTTIAPTGTTSMLGNTTGGCEPMYNIAFYKNVSGDVQGDEMLVEFDDYFLRVLEANDIPVEPVKEEAETLMANNEFSADALTTVPSEITDLFVTTGQLSAKEHAAIQCALQEGVDSSISKTVNAPNEDGKESAREVFEFIYKNGGKGVTYYRDGTRSKQVLTTRAQNSEFSSEDVNADELLEVVEDHTENEWFRQELAELLLEAAQEESGDELTVDEFVNELGMGVVGTDTNIQPTPRSREKALYGRTEKVKTGYGSMYVTINEDDEGLVEVFAQIGKSGGFMNSFTESIARLVSMALRSGIPAEDIIESLEDIRSPKIAWDDGDKVQSIPDGIATAIERYLNSEERVLVMAMQGVQVDTPAENGFSTEQVSQLSSVVDSLLDEESLDGIIGGVDTTEETTPELSETKEEAEVETDSQEDHSEGLTISDDSELGEPTRNGDESSVEEMSGDPLCPECQSLDLYYSEGCKTCENCGWSEC